MGPLEKWLLANAATINLQIRIFDNPTLNFLDICDIEAEIEISKKKYWGRGTAFDQSLALKKACSEAIERFFLHKNGFPTSNGMSAHVNEALAIETATLELIERDLFLCKYLTQTPFFEIYTSNSLIDRARQFLKKQNINLKFYSMGSINSVQSILCAIDGLSCQKPFGYIFGSSSGKSESAIESSFLEAYRNFGHHKDGQSISLTEFFKKITNSKVEFTDHGNLALDTNYAKTFKNIFFNCIKAEDINELIDLNLTYEVLSMANTHFEGAPLSIVRVFSPNLQNLFLGQTFDKNINFHRLKKFSTAYKKSYELYKIPHPFN